MKKLSGEFLARLLVTLKEANGKEMSPEEFVKQLSEAMKVENLYCSTEVSPKYVRDRVVHKRLDHLDEQSLSGLNAMLPWSSYFAFGDDKILGVPWSDRKRNAPQPFPDNGVVKLHQRVPLDGLSVLELGCYEGHHSVSLAQFSPDVWAIDGRIENVIKTLVRVWGAGLEKRVTVDCLDLEQGELDVLLKHHGRDAPFDLVHHRGVLYHLSDPVNHLAACARICSKHLYLHTQIAHEDKAADVFVRQGREYRVFKYKEPKSTFSPFSGITTQALWMTRSSLVEVLKDVGFGQVEILSEVEERNGPRIELLASQ